MRFNLLLYVPALDHNLDIEYGIFIQHHLMDDADVTIDYFDFSKINPENYALDIVIKNQVTKKVRKDCLVEGFTLNSHYSIDLNNNFNRNIVSDEVRQIFICFKNTHIKPIDAFICLTHGEETTNYKIKDNLIFFRLWVDPEMQNNSDVPLHVGKINYTDFNYFCDSVKTAVNDQWHAILRKKIDHSKIKLQENVQESNQNTQPNENAKQKTIPIKQKSDTVPSVKKFVTPVSATPHIADKEIVSPSQINLAIDHKTLIDGQKGSRVLQVVAYTLLFLGVLSLLIKIFGS